MCVVATASAGQEQELSAMPGRFVNAIFGELDCALDISGVPIAVLAGQEPLPRSFLACRTVFPLAERNGGQFRNRVGHRELRRHRRLAPPRPLLRKRICTYRMVRVPGRVLDVAHERPGTTQAEPLR